MNPSKEQRALNIKQAIANTAIEGHTPSPDFLADCEAVAAGTMTPEEAIAAALERATKKQQTGMSNAA